MMNQHVDTSRPALSAGKQVGAIIPTTIDEIWRVSNAVCQAGLAPYSLIKGKQNDAAVSAVSVAIMSGAELGLPPMTSLRSFAVINGRPALFGDGLVNVCRRSGLVEHIKRGFDKEGQFGWCEAKRKDTGEFSRTEFSMADAKKAGLTSGKPDAVWSKYPERMCNWRATGFNLRDLFADVLGGILTDIEAEDIASDEMRDVTPQKSSATISPPIVSDVEIEEPAETPEELFARAETYFKNSETLDDLETVWDAHFSEIDLGSDDEANLVFLYEQAQNRFASEDSTKAA